MFTRIGLDEMEVNFLRGFLAEIEKRLLVDKALKITFVYIITNVSPSSRA